MEQDLLSGSLVPSTLKDMEQDTELAEHMATLAAHGQAALTREEKLKRQRSLDKIDVKGFLETCKAGGVSPLVRAKTRVFQVNIGLYCNQACTHCHVESSPKRTEMMDRATVERCLDLLRSAVPSAAGRVQTLDITGGAPEMNQNFRYLVTEARKLGVPEIIDRCNLTVLLEPGQEDLVQFLADNKVRIVASLPCYSEKNTDSQRGAGVFQRSIKGLQMLNAAGYGKPGTGLMLDLVYNPGGAFLAPSQDKLQDAYKTELREAYGIEFNTLLALNNLPIKRFADWLVRRDKLDEYMQLLVNNFNPAAAEGVMCRDTVSIGWDGRLYDCDFNQQLEMNMAYKPKPSSSSGLKEAHHLTEQSHISGKKGLTIFDVQSLEELEGARIVVDNHCFGCTAGAGSSCGGQL